MSAAIDRQSVVTLVDANCEVHLEFRVLGALEVDVGGRMVDLRQRRQRALLALLIINAGNPISSERIVDSLWGENPPASGVKTVHVYVSQLRAALEPARQRNQPSSVLVTTPAGSYELAIQDSAIDARRFESLVDEAGALSTADPAQAVKILETAEALWRGDAYAEFRYEEFAQAEIIRLEALRLSATRQRIGCELELGRHSEVLGELELLADEHPYDEQLIGLQMTALYRTGRAADAVSRFESLRQALADRGMEPLPALSELVERILLHDDRLRPPGSPNQLTNLPAMTTAFVDREEDCNAVAQLLAHRRVVTLHGPGGIGKTRLALEAASQVIGEFRDGVWFVDLSASSSERDVHLNIAEALGVSEQVGEGILPALLAHLRNRVLLLVLDGGEHLVQPLRGVCHAALTAGPGVTLVVTSRERLRLAGEVVWRVSPLSLDAGAEGGSAAAELFVDRAASADATLSPSELDCEAVEAICRRVDGIPLAVELAASRMSILSLEELNERLGRDLGALGTREDSPVPGHGDTMQAVIEWSHQMLSGDEQQLLHRLAVFRGGFTLDAVEHICVDDSLVRSQILDLSERLADTSFVVRDDQGGHRLRMLDTIREFAEARLDEAGEVTWLRDSHARYFATLAETAGEGLSSPEQASWLVRLDQDRANLALACSHAVATGDRALAISLASNLAPFFLDRGYHSEGRDMLAAVVDLAPSPRSLDEVSALSGLAVLAQWNGHTGEATELADRVRSASQSIGSPQVSSRAARLTATIEWARGRFREAAAAELEALDLLRTTQSPLRALVTGQAAFLLVNLGRLAEAGTLRDELRTLVPHAPPEVGPLELEVDASFAFHRGDNLRAMGIWTDAAEGYETVGLRAHLADAALLGAWAALEGGAFSEASELAERALARARDTTAPFFEARALAVLAWVDLRVGELALGTRKMRASFDLLDRGDDRFWLLWHLGAAARHAADISEYRRAAALVGARDTLFEHTGIVAPATVAAADDELATSCKAALGIEEWTEAHTAGQALQLVGLLDFAEPWLSGGT